MQTETTNTAQANFMLTEAEFNLIRTVVYKHCKISLNDDKIALVRARVTKQMRTGGFLSVKDYLDHVLSDHKSAAFIGFIDSISTNLTSFFRENQHFEYLSKVFLPNLMAKKRKAGDTRIMAWSAACSSGEEPYTLAMTLLEAAEQNPGAKCDFRLLATDISTAVLSTARTGVYAAPRMAGVPDRHRSKYFTACTTAAGERAYEVSPELRQIIRFRHLNLMDAWPFSGPFDFIFCRNVMIYFDKQTQQTLVERYWNCLRPGGLLFTGHSESLTGVKHRLTHRRPSVYEKCDL
ncbi:MAG: protein-glutamate O-methyltransferase CheR [Phycisphaerales bacterium]|nr:protein-glutamate O-methyltransferase CheR [Phycisphaerales bacterium]